MEWNLFVCVCILVLVPGCSKGEPGPTDKTESSGHAVASSSSSTQSPGSGGGQEASRPANTPALIAWEPAEPVELRLWHTYRDMERKALSLAVDAFNRASKNIKLVSNYTPYDGFENKLRITITQGEQGPDLFIDAHDKLGSYVANKMVAPLNTVITDASLEGFDEFVGRAMMQNSNLYGLPLALKPLALFYNKAFITKIPESMEALVAQLGPLQKKERALRGGGEPFYGFVYEAGNLFFHGQWLTAFGAEILDPTLRPMLDTRAQEKALAFARALHKEHEFVPVGIDGNMVVSYFNNKQAAVVLSGPWLRASINQEIDYGVAMIPTLTGRKAKPYVTVEGVYVARSSKHLKAAAKAALFLARPESAKLRMEQGLQVVAHGPTLASSKDPINLAFMRQAKNGVLLDARPEMGAVWKAVNEVLQKGVFGENAHIPSLLRGAQEKVVLDLRKLGRIQ
jgi:arabinogalactan oligomer/maltooligosaccharide transport system permease protein